jgi:U3 small nucleolar ribonucleoprotein component
MGFFQAQHIIYNPMGDEKEGEIRLRSREPKEENKTLEVATEKKRERYGGRRRRRRRSEEKQRRNDGDGEFIQRSAESNSTVSG